jgi:hypothetical protein
MPLVPEQEAGAHAMKHVSVQNGDKCWWSTTMKRQELETGVTTTWGHEGFHVVVSPYCMYPEPGIPEAAACQQSEVRTHVCACGEAHAIKTPCHVADRPRPGHRRRAVRSALIILGIVLVACVFVTPATGEKKRSAMAAACRRTSPGETGAASSCISTCRRNNS